MSAMCESSKAHERSSKKKKNENETDELEDERTKKKFVGVQVVDCAHRRRKRASLFMTRKEKKCIFNFSFP